MNEWKKELLKPSPSLLRAFYRAFGFTFTLAGFYKLLQDLLGFIGYDTDVRIGNHDCNILSASQ